HDPHPATPALLDRERRFRSQHVRGARRRDAVAGGAARARRGAGAARPRAARGPLLPALQARAALALRPGRGGGGGPRARAALPPARPPPPPGAAPRGPTPPQPRPA